MKLNKSKKKKLEKKDVCDWLKKRKGFPTGDEEFESDVVETLKSAGFRNSREFVQQLNNWNKPTRKNN